MEQTTNDAIRSLIDRPPPCRSGPGGSAPIPRRLPRHLIRKALHSGRDRRRGRAQRRDGWTPGRIRSFLDALARSGSVAKAAVAVGMSRQSAYALRGSAKGRAFDDAWRAALLLAAPSVADEAMERAIHGQVDPVFRNGKLWGHRHRYDNRLALRLLRRLDRQAASKSEPARLLQSVAKEFDAFVAIVSSGDEEQADAFLRSRSAALRSGRQASTLSTLPGASDPVAPPLRPASSPEGGARRRQPPIVSTLPACDMDENGGTTPDITFLDGVPATHANPWLEKAA